MDLDLSAIQNFIDAHPIAVGLAFVWVMAWKGVALWRTAERGQRLWFVVILLANTLGLLEIIYLFFVMKPIKRANDSTKSTEPA